MRLAFGSKWHEQARERVNERVKQARKERAAQMFTSNRKRK